MNAYPWEFSTRSLILSETFFLLETDDMTETDSGFSHSRSSDGSQCDKSGNTSPAMNSVDESNSQADNSENLLINSNGGNDQDSKNEESNTNSDSMQSSSEDSDDDYEDSESGEKKSVFSWVSVKVKLRLEVFD